MTADPNDPTEMLDEMDGGPAFPVTAEQSPSGVFPSPGMTLRDYFAGQALPMLIEFLKHDARDYGLPYVDYCAQQAYATADAMLKARRS